MKRNPKHVRAFMDGEVAPVISNYWGKDAFPFELLPAVHLYDSRLVGSWRTGPTARVQLQEDARSK